MNVTGFKVALMMYGIVNRLMIPPASSLLIDFLDCAFLACNAVFRDDLAAETAASCAFAWTFAVAAFTDFASDASSSSSSSSDSSSSSSSLLSNSISVAASASPPLNCRRRLCGTVDESDDKNAVGDVVRTNVVGGVDDAETETTTIKLQTMIKQ
eukprot:CAMPEP_0113472038 /NCGR_PEP_ID=MMETSP0014_2-20120614/17301_1 /TAXON_ID=2857 /ORGANISM="Nitzschia sp." /LENGTH=154 /DNA_ID=CAMNT_0000364719 /DNA_START=662 /DNA_END=1126 /DNA_ORIENTATION=+ /assembly_acc=CAM_ASM_000159